MQRCRSFRANKSLVSKVTSWAALCATFFCVTIFLKAPVFAQNISFLNRGPIAYLDDVDKQILTDSLNAALNDGADGEIIEWGNADTGSKGRIEVIDTHEDYGTTCRTVRTFTKASGREGGGIYRLCLADDDTWQFAPKRRKPS